VLPSRRQFLATRGVSAPQSDIWRLKAAVAAPQLRMARVGGLGPFPRIPAAPWCKGMPPRDFPPPSSFCHLTVAIGTWASPRNSSELAPRGFFRPPQRRFGPFFGTPFLQNFTRSGFQTHPCGGPYLVILFYYSWNSAGPSDLKFYCPGHGPAINRWSISKGSWGTWWTLEFTSTPFFTDSFSKLLALIIRPVISRLNYISRYY
jgi:hypothetical protein